MKDRLKVKRRERFKERQRYKDKDNYDVREKEEKFQNLKKKGISVEKGEKGEKAGH